LAHVFIAKNRDTYRTMKLPSDAYLAVPQVDWEVDELTVLLNEVLDAVLFQVLVRFLLEMETDRRTATESVAARVLDDAERARV